MKELINQILNFWSNYWGDSLFSYLLILAAAYLLIFKRKEENVKYVLNYLLIMLFLSNGCIMFNFPMCILFPNSYCGGLVKRISYCQF